MRPAEGAQDVSAGDGPGEGVLCGCGSRVPPGAQPEQSSAVGTRVVDVVLSATLGWQAGLWEKPPPPSSCPPGSQHKHWPWPWGETDTWLFCTVYRTLVLVNIHQPIRRAREIRRGEEKTLTLRIVFTLKLLSPSFPSRFLRLCPMSDVKGQL